MEASTPPPTPPRPTSMNMTATGRIPQLGNAEFALYVLANGVAAIVVCFADTMNVNDWFTFFTVTTAVYVLSRGIAKASRVFEH
jgi:hypothetical protein